MLIDNKAQLIAVLLAVHQLLFLLFNYCLYKHIKSKEENKRERLTPAVCMNDVKIKRKKTIDFDRFLPDNQ
jgi:hypothetical protein